MSDKENGTPVLIIKKKGHGHGGHHGGAWKVAYADFVTAMMAFFMVMWLVNQRPEIRAGVAAYMQDPLGYADKVGKIGDDGAGGNGPSAVDGMMLAPGSSPPAPPAPPAPKSVAPPQLPAPTRPKLESAAKQIKESLTGVSEFRKLGSNVQITVTPEGVLIDLVEDEDTSFYASGGRTLLPEAVGIVSAIGSTIANEGLTAIVEGHTDALPFQGKADYGNWELSTDRANAARRILEQSGVTSADVLAVRGYADRRPKYPDHPDDPRNRRVSILVREKDGAAQAAKADEEGAPAPASEGGAPAAVSPDAAPATSPDVLHSPPAPVAHDEHEAVGTPPAAKRPLATGPRTARSKRSRH